MELADDIRSGTDRYSKYLLRDEGGGTPERGKTFSPSGQCLFLLSLNSPGSVTLPFSSTWGKTGFVVPHRDLVH